MRRDLIVAATLGVAAGYLLRLAQEAVDVAAADPRTDSNEVPRAVNATTVRTFDAYQREALHPDTRPPEGYGAIIMPTSMTRPPWLHPDEIVARHLPMGLSERKAGYVVGWDHAYRLRDTHPYYATE